VLITVLVAGVVTRTFVRARRRRTATPGLHKHPERLDQMLDPTDDA
jgi:hypothetical protein